ncbi:MAG: hypothetical protein ACE5MK_12795 [Acidobacteriota bacterium]
MKLLSIITILSLIILSLAIFWSWVLETARAQRASDYPSSSRTGLLGLPLAVLITLAIGLSPLHAEPQMTMVNLRGDQVVAPMNVPPKARFVLQRVINVDDRLIVFLYSDPRFQHPVDYAETYNLKGELLEVAWYEPTEGLKIARDINLGNRKAQGPARILEMVDVREHGLLPDRRPDTVTEGGRLSRHAD